MSAVAIPTIETERLTLRAPRLEDFEPHFATVSSERARHIGGPFSREDAWRRFSGAAGGWVLRGYGGFAIEERASGLYCGLMLVHRQDWYPEDEIGWILTEAAEGRGIGFEAASAARDWAWRALGRTTLVSYIDPDNLRSRRLAERLGARPDPAAANPFAPRPIVVYRHRRTPGARAA